MHAMAEGDGGYYRSWRLFVVRPINYAFFHLPSRHSSDFVMGMDLRVRQAGAALAGLVPELAVPGTRISDVVQVWGGNVVDIII